MVAVSVAIIIVGCGGRGSGREVENGVFQIKEKDIIALDRSLDGVMVESWEPVFLEDSKEALIADLKGEIMYDDGLFFIGSRQRSTSEIKVFDSAGHYLHDISHQGRAEYEYLGIAEWTLDPVRNEVLVIDSESSYQIKYYDYSGKFLRMLDLGDEYSAWPYGMEPVCLSDGTLLLHNPLCLYQCPEYVTIHPDGTVDSPFELTEDKIIGEESRYYGGVAMGWKYYNPNGDEVWLTRRFDNHLYKLVASDSVQCMADIAFIGEVSEKIRQGLDVENRGVMESISEFILAECRNFKDYFSFQYVGRPPMLFDKTTCKTYQFNENDSTAYLPKYYEWQNSSVNGNDWIVFLEPQLVEKQNEFINGSEYDGRYSKEIEEFFREASKTENVVLLVLHLRSPEKEWTMPYRLK